MIMRLCRSQMIVIMCLSVSRTADEFETEQALITFAEMFGLVREMILKAAMEDQ
jgi:hypothetical protein